MREEKRLLGTPLEFAPLVVLFYVFSISYDVIKGNGPF